MKKRWILCTVAVLCIAAALLGCGKKNVGTPQDNSVVEQDHNKNDNMYPHLYCHTSISTILLPSQYAVA